MSYKKILIKNLIFTVIALFLCCLMLISAIMPVNALKSKSITVCLDAGHGGIDGGAEGITTKVKESDLNLLIVLELKKLLEKSGVSVILTRADENGLYGDSTENFKTRDLKKRLEIYDSSNAQLFISIHLNKYSSSSRRGAQVFFKKGDENSEKLAKNIQLELNLLKESKRSYDALSGDYYLLNNSEKTAVIVECGFLSNPEEERLLLSDEYRKRVAKRIYGGILRYFSCI